MLSLQAKMLSPQKEKDGIDHINIYSKGKTELGRFLSNFARAPINTKDGYLESIEGYWYWLSNGYEPLRKLSGFEAKQQGKKQSRVIIRTEHDFKSRIWEACWIKIHSNAYYLKLFKESKLPFTHYYVFINGYIKDGGHEWLCKMWETFRKTYDVQGSSRV